MNKHVVAIGMLAIGLLCVVSRCEKLEEKLTLKTLECDAYKLCSKVYKHLYEEEQQKSETKEA